MSAEKTNIVIIGAGASGTLTAIQLLRKLNRPAVIYIIEKNEASLFRGTAYSSKLTYEPLNVPAGKMSAFNHLPDSFFNWVVEKRDANVNRESFVSRRWFGDYLGELVQQYRAGAAQVKLEHVIAAVNSVEPLHPFGGYKINLSTGAQLNADYIVFATGNEAPGDIFTAAELKELEGLYISNPWQVNPFANLTGNEDILIIGTGLTMVDHVLSLHAIGHKGHVTCFSRNGYLPLPHSDSFNYNFEGSYSEKSLHEILTQLHNNLLKVDDKTLNWQSVIDAFRPRVPRVWRNLTIKEKAYFLKRLRNFWEIHRHRAPQLSHQIIADMRTKGQLQIVSGRYQRITRQGNQAMLQYTSRAGDELVINAGLIINCTGPSGDYMRCNNNLIKQVLQNGWMKQDELKLGIETGIRGEIMMSNGIVLKNSFAVGPMRKACEWESTAIREIRTQAEDIASLIADKVDALHDVLVDI